MHEEKNFNNMFDMYLLSFNLNRNVYPNSMFKSNLYVVHKTD